MDRRVQFSTASAIAPFVFICQNEKDASEVWLNSLHFMNLSEGRRTAVGRNAVVKLLRLRLESYQHLLAAVQKSDPRAMDNYRSEEIVVLAEIKKFAASR
ncbi:MAG: hypothetical protein H7343_21835 [Undibacterium sp.]|nr:hypothetical protein [Opitutaceae bacterium]